jgi:sulfite reductase beta subunit-like hemoprotein
LGIATYEHVCNEVLCNDLAIILQPHDLNPAELVAAVFVGGSLAFRLEHSETFPQLAKYACTVRLDEILPFVRGLVQAFQKYGPRLQRRRSRLKYWLEAIGMDELLRLTILEASRPIQPVVLAASPDIPPTAKHRGIHSYHAATFVGLKWKAWGLNGGDEQLQHGLQNVDFPWLKQWYLTTHQEVLFGPLSQISFAEISAGIEQSGLARYILEPSLHDIRDGLQDSENFLPQVMSCAALPTCSLAVSDAEGHKAELVSWLAEFQSISGLARGEIDCRISGCTNNCSRPLLSDIGIIAHGPNRYGVYVGGNHAEQKLARYTGQEFPWGPALKAYLHELVVRQ